MTNLKIFTDNDIKKLEPAEKIGLIATINDEGRPHITLITSAQPLSGDKMVFGEFSWGLSKYNVKKNPKTAFLMMTLDRSLWRGRALWTRSAKEGPEYIKMNEKPMFRYNTYFGINTVHYLDVIENSGREGLPLAGIAASMALTRLAGNPGKNRSGAEPLNGLALSFVNRIDSLKFLAYAGDDGYPEIIPLLQCRAASPSVLKFSPAAYSDLMKKIPAGAETAVFAMTLGMESVLMRGIFSGYKRSRLIKTGFIDINWVYNSMPPVHGQVYPPVKLEPVREF